MTNITGYWSCENPTIQAIISADASTDKIEVFDLPYGNTVFHWNLNDQSCGKKSAPITITNNQVNGFAGNDEYICVDSYTMKADQMPVKTAKGTWTIDASSSVTGATIVAADENNPNMTINNLGRGKTTFVWTVKNFYDEDDDTKFCKSEKTVAIYNMDFDIDAYVGSTEKDMDVCGKTGNLSADPVITGCVGTWTVNGTGVIKDADKNKADAPFALSGESNDFTWTVVRTFTNAKGENQTCTKVDNVTVHDRTPNPTASTGLTTCDGTKQLNALPTQRLLLSNGTSSQLAPHSPTV